MHAPRFLEFRKVPRSWNHFSPLNSSQERSEANGKWRSRFLENVHCSIRVHNVVRESGIIDLERRLIEALALLWASFTTKETLHYFLVFSHAFQVENQFYIMVEISSRKKNNFARSWLVLSC